jgi:hypothetical protein
MQVKVFKQGTVLRRINGHEPAFVNSTHKQTHVSDRGATISETTDGKRALYRIKARRKYSIGLALWLVATGAQQSAATVVLARITEQNLTVAADSRGTTVDGRRVDNVCKIAALNSHTVFAAGGMLQVTVNDNNPFIPAWSALGVASEALRRVRPTSVGSLAEEWANIISSNLRWDLLMEFWPTIQGMEPDGGIVMGMFAIGTAGIQEFQATFLTLKCLGYPFCYAIERVWKPVPFGDIGFLGDSTAFSAVSRAARRYPNLPDNSQRLRSLIQKAIETGVSDTIGGDVDALELKHFNSVRWIHRKSNCPEH